ncbi:hypothetical protein GCM10007415_00150 [Parapedobacter pyrenivorans]|uniref:Uncharacterized protein n=1 Tax=Parapedobacter pyrenivorans TaxID=1305674 RepID=A0A917HAQ9_9SPHI|nr:hypothetical protein GCM10007415_00150 [Parapedobacter pyrenivorans]
MISAKLLKLCYCHRHEVLAAFSNQGESVYRADAWGRGTLKIIHACSDRIQVTIFKVTSGGQIGSQIFLLFNANFNAILKNKCG